jgi:hypothetical protein
MKTGVQYNAPLQLTSIAEGGFSYAEIPYEVIRQNALPTYQKSKESNHVLMVSGLSYPLKDLTPEILYDMLVTCQQYQGNYIVLDTLDCPAGILEEIVEECSMMLNDFEIPLFLENGCDQKRGGFFHNAYSEAADLIAIADYCNRLCERPIIGIAINIGYANLVTKNIRKLLNSCSRYLCLIHANDNDGFHNDAQMPYTFTKGRGDLTTDWFRVLREMIDMEFGGWLIFDTKGLFARAPQCLHTQMIRLQHSITETWQAQFTFEKRVLDQPDKELILFGAGQMLVDYLNTLGKKYPPAFAVDNGQERWGTQVRGVPVRDPKAILEVPPEKRNVVVCCMYYDAIETQLKAMGVEYEEFIDKYYI